mmetsp:Transcript_54115/g.116849  ORF Transcript_54115/g.116849 Transcript_54115/m.116849 type:complete len:252 (+) Transcript_54115:86-841(+)
MAASCPRSRSRSPARELEVSDLSGKSWRVPLEKGEHVIELRRKVAKLADLQPYEVALVQEGKVLADDALQTEIGTAGLQLIRREAIVPDIKKLTAAIAELKEDSSKFEFQEEEWASVDCHEWKTFQGRPVSEDHELNAGEVHFTTGDPMFTLLRYNISANPDIHAILAKAWLAFSSDDEEMEEPEELKEQESFMESFAELENSTEEIEKELYPADAGKDGCKTYCLYEDGNQALSAAISPEWVYVYSSNWG